MNRGVIFDCDGVLVDSEEIHRICYNKSFKLHGTGVEWSEDLYEKLQNSIGGGKEKIYWYFQTFGWPENLRNEMERKLWVVQLQRLTFLSVKDKTILYLNTLKSGQISLRPGIGRIIDEAYQQGWTLCVCSAANARAVNLVMECILQERAKKFSFILAGDIVSRKKPDPQIYLLAKEKLRLPADSCIVIEDSQIGLQAALAAGLRCVITPTKYTKSQNFDGAAAVYYSLEDGFRLEQLFILKNASGIFNE
eukprot:jgi/Galph1/3532/GphlegSOOS_G2203.1